MKHPGKKMLCKHPFSSQRTLHRFLSLIPLIHTLPPAKRCLKAHGISYSESKTARKVTAADYDNFDLILCMDRSNIRRIRRIIPEDPANKIHLMMSCVSMANAYIHDADAEADGYACLHDAGAESAPDVADPWYTGDFETTFQDLLLSCEALLSSLLSAPLSSRPR